MNNNQPTQQNSNQVLVSWITSDITKTIAIIVFTTVSISFVFSNNQNEIKTSLLEMNHKMDMNNLMLENRIKAVEDKEDRMEKKHDSDMSFIINNYTKRIK